MCPFASCVPLLGVWSSLSTYYVPRRAQLPGLLLEAAGGALGFFFFFTGEHLRFEKSRCTAPCRLSWTVPLRPAVGLGRPRLRACGAKSAPDAPLPVPNLKARAIFSYLLGGCNDHALAPASVQGGLISGRPSVLCLLSTWSRRPSL